LSCIHGIQRWFRRNFQKSLGFPTGNLGRRKSIFSYYGFIVLVTRFLNRSHSWNSFIAENRSKMWLTWPQSQSQYIHGDIKSLDVEA
jgi:hypothetical protein